MKKTPAVKPAATNKPFWYNYLFPASAVLITLLVFARVTGFDFVSLDDESYVVQNNDIKDLSPKSVKTFFTSYYVGMYQPVTMMTYAFDYKLFKLNPAGYHFINLLFHLLNTLLVFFLIYRISGKRFIAFLAAVLFGIHPMHVESVAWIAERKDVVYAFFYLISLLFYVKYKTEKQKPVFLIISMLSFALSLLSKSMAVTLPAVIVLIDLYFKKSFSWKSIMEKLPYFVLAIVFCIVAYISQKSQGGLNPLSTYSLADRFFISLYALVYYPVMLFLPYQQSVYHYFPSNAAGFLPIEYYGTVLVPLAVYFIYRKIKNYRMEFIGGLLFYIVTVLPVIQIISIGDSVVSERYTYLPYLGLFFMFIFPLNGLLEESKKAMPVNKKVLISGISLILLVFSLLSFTRAGVWKNSNKLLTNLTEKNPDNDHGYFLRGNYYLKVNNFYDAIDDYNKAITLNAKNAKAYYHRGKSKAALNNPKGAADDYEMAISLGYKHPDIYNDLGVAGQTSGDLKTAVKNFGEALKMKPDFAEAYVNRGNTYLFAGEYQKAIDDYNKAGELNLRNADMFYNRGVAKARLLDFKGSLSDFDEVIRINPDDAQVYYLRGFSYFSLKEMKNACDDWQTSFRKGNTQVKPMIDKNCKNIK